jgi:hypothetical protein
MNRKDKIKSYAAQRGISTVGAFKNETATRRLIEKFTPKQQKRLAKV